jgi:hypothetical protein
MFSIGFKELIEKFEEYFGKRATKIAVGIFGAAVVLFVIGFAVRESVYPFGLWLGAIATGQPQFASAISGIGVLATVLWLVLVVSLLATLFRMKPVFDRLEIALAPEGAGLIEKVLRAHEQMDRDRDEARQLLFEAKALHQEAERVLADVESGIGPKSKD